MSWRSIIRLSVGLFVIGLTVLLSMVISSGNMRRKIRQASMLLLGWAMIVGLWFVRNYLLTGMIFFHTLSGPHFLNHGAVRVVMMADHCSYDQAQQKVYVLLAVT
jgi:hypothetical protein